MSTQEDWTLGRARALRLVLAEVNGGLTEGEQAEALDRTGIVLDEILGDDLATELVIRGLVDLIVMAQFEANVEDDDPRAAITAELEAELLDLSELGEAA